MSKHANRSINRQHEAVSKIANNARNDWRQMLKDRWLSVDDIEAYIGIKQEQATDASDFELITSLVIKGDRL